MGGIGPEEEHRDLDRDELLAIDVPAMLAAGVSDGDGIRGELLGTGQAAAAVQLEADGLPLDMLGRMLTMVNRHTWEAAVADVDVIVEEPDKRGFPRAARSSGRESPHVAAATTTSTSPAGWPTCTCSSPSPRAAEPGARRRRRYFA